MSPRKNGHHVKRTEFLYYALGMIGIPYLWGGKNRNGLDCSGVVTLALYEAGGPDWRWTHNTDVLWAELESVGDPQPGDLAFYGGKGADVNHVMVMGPLGLVFGACGGDAETTSLTKAVQIGARVKPRRLVLYRSDFRGFRKLNLD